MSVRKGDKPTEGRALSRSHGASCSSIGALVRGTSPMLAGVGFYFTWLNLFLFVPYQSGFAYFNPTAWLVGALGFALLAILVYSRRKGAIPLAQMRWPVPSGIALMCTGSLIFIIGGMVRLPLGVSILIPLLSGVGAALLLVQWGSIYSMTDTRKVMLALGYALILSAVIELVAMIASDVHDVFLLLACPLLMGLTTRFGLCKPVLPSSGFTSRIQPMKTLLNLSIGIIVIGLVFGVVLGLSPTMPIDAVIAAPISGYILAGAYLVTSLMFILGATVFGSTLSLRFSWRPMIPLMVTAIVLIPFLPANLSSLPLAVISGAWMAAQLLVLLGLASIARVSGLSSDTVFSMGLASITLPVAIGMLVGHHFLAALMGSPVSLSYLGAPLVIILVIVSSFFLNDKTLDTSGLLGQLPTSPEESSPVVVREVPIDPFSKACEQIAQRGALTQREIQVLGLFARGRSRSYIAEALFISENTVRGHIKSIYEKLDMHSKQELLDQIESLEK